MMVADCLPEVLLSLIMTHSLMTRVPLMEAMTGTEMSLPFSGLLNDGSGPYRGRDSFRGMPNYGHGPFVKAGIPSMNFASCCEVICEKYLFLIHMVFRVMYILS